MTDKSREEALAHFGVKGMKWGIRNEKDNDAGEKSKAEASLGKTSSKITKEEYNELIKNQPKKTRVEQAKSIAENKTKFKAKFEPTDKSESTKPPEKKGWRPTKKQVAIAAIGAAYIGLAASSYYMEKNAYGGQPFTQDFRQSLKLKPIAALIKPGESCTFSQYNDLINGSIGRTWGMKGYFTEYSYDRPELTFPAGHIFHRLSQGIETEFGNRGNYCVSSKLEMARYLASQEFGSATKHVTWSSTSEVKVPALSTVLETAKLALSEAKGKQVSNKEAFSWYRQQTGGGWYKDGTVTSKFFEMLKNQGYHAIVDEMDAGVMAENPLVWFNTAAASAKQTSKLTKEEMDEARRILTEIAHRK
ncbi:MAG TPA: hypothetical protein PLM10_02040 [Saccharofermentans sp.]|nr:hypothetical protein [Saccharofermentans sp.]